MHFDNEIAWEKIKNSHNLCFFSNVFRFAIVENMNGSGVSLFAIFDGHGGEYVADYCKEQLVNNICDKIVETKKLSTDIKNPAMTHDNNKIEIHSQISQSTAETQISKFLENGNDVNYGKIFTSEILIADQKLVEDLRNSNSFAGSTAVIAVIDGSKLTVANVGDSRAVMCDFNGTAIPLSFDHKPEKESEKNRIEKAGGYVAFWGVWRVNGNLATSRALGDYTLKPNFVIANPDILEFDLMNHR